MTSVLVWHDKHGDTMYDASTDEKFAAACISILRDWLEYDYIVEPTWPPSIYDIKLETQNLAKRELPALDATLSDSELEALVNERMAITKAKAKMEKARQSYDNEMAHYQTVVDTVQQNDRSVRTNNRGRTTPNAWLILQRYCVGEYQDVQLETLIDATTE